MIHSVLFRQAEEKQTGLGGIVVTSKGLIHMVADVAAQIGFAGVTDAQVAAADALIASLCKNFI